MTSITELITRQQAEAADLQARHRAELAAVLPPGDRLLTRRPGPAQSAARTAFENRRALMHARRLDARLPGAATLPGDAPAATKARRPRRAKADPAPETAA